MKELNYEKVFQVLVEETSNYIRSNRLRAMVLGVSGGIDSTVVAAICHEVSKQTGIPLIGRSLPIRNKEDEFNISELVGKAFCTDFKVVNLEIPYTFVLNWVAFEEYGYDPVKSMREDEDIYQNIEKHIPEQTPIANGNIQARLRMTYLYNLASINKGLVMSTDNQTEYQLGFWTIHGDVGDFDPIQGLWKTEVYELAEWLVDFYFTDGDDASKAVAIRESMKLTPTDGLGISNSDLEQIGAKSYNDVDRLLKTLTCKASPENDKLQDELTEELGRDVVGKILERHIKSKFKRLLSPIIVPREKYAGLS
jgi:NAD+ synthetase